MPPTKPTVSRTARAAGTGPSPQWVSTSMMGLMPGTTLVPFTGDSIFLTRSPECAVAFWNPADRFLGYYRVVPEDEPIAVNSAPGIYRCDRATILRQIDPPTAGAVVDPARSARHHAA